MRHREAAELEIRVERLHVAQDRVARGGVAVVSHGGLARQRGDHPRVTEIVADEAQAAVRVEPGAVVADDARRLLAAMLQRVQTECGHGRGVGYAPDPEDAAFLVQRVPVQQLLVCLWAGL